MTANRVKIGTRDHAVRSALEANESPHFDELPFTSACKQVVIVGGLQLLAGVDRKAQPPTDWLTDEPTARQRRRSNIYRRAAQFAPDEAGPADSRNDRSMQTLLLRQRTISAGSKYRTKRLHEDNFNSLLKRSYS